MPAWDLLPMHRYGAGSRNHPGLAAIEASRGCFDSCEYCVLWRQMGKFVAEQTRPYVRTKSVARLLPGVLFGAEVVCYLWLTAGPRVTTLRDLDLRGCLTYTAGIAATLLFVPAASLFGNVTAWYALVALASLGLASLALLVALNLALSIAWLARRLLHLHPA